jgi:diacylglycerol kinase family enzyme
VRALLIINPRASSMSGREAGLVVRELGSRLELETAQTQYRGHARELAGASAARGYDLVVTFGGDGTVNEVVNGLMTAPARGHAGPPRAAAAADGDAGKGRDAGKGGDGAETPGTVTAAAASAIGAAGTADVAAATARPAIAPVPGGGANVFARTLGLPPDPAAAVRRIAAAAASGKRRTIGLGAAGDRYFTFSAGLGVDAEVMADVDRLRARGRRASTMLYLRTALRRYYYVTDRRRPALTLEAPGQPPVKGLFMGVVTNSSPWTYLGNRPVRPAPHSDFNSGLDLFALRRLRTLTTLAALGHMMHTNEQLPSGRDVVSAAAQTELAFRADRPIAFHIDGEYQGETEEVTFRFVPEALCVLA